MIFGLMHQRPPEMDLADCDAGSCLSIETQEQATEALEGVEIMMEQVNECLAE